jgi:hypothetical protein
VFALTLVLVLAPGAGLRGVDVVEWTMADVRLIVVIIVLVLVIPVRPSVSSSNAVVLR